MIYLISALVLLQQAPPPKFDIEWVRLPGRVELVFQDKCTDAQRKAFETQFGLPPQAGPVKSRMQGEKVVARVFRYEVVPGQETFWVEALKKHPLVREAEWPKATGASSTNQVFLAASAGMRKLPSTGIEMTKAMDVGATLQAVLRQWFEQRHGVFRVLDSKDNFMKLQIRDLRGEVLPQAKRWEILEIVTVFFAAPTGIQIHLVLDGKFAAGLGRTPPPDDSFDSMEKGFFKEQDQYLQTLSVAVRAELVKRGAAR